MNINYINAKTTFLTDLIMELTQLNEKEFDLVYEDFNAVIHSIHTLEKKLKTKEADNFAETQKTKRI